VSKEPFVEFWDLISAGLGVCERADRRVVEGVHDGVYPRKDRFLYWSNEEYRSWMGREPLG
jgi:hypothetical protein